MPENVVVVYMSGEHWGAIILTMGYLS